MICWKRLDSVLNTHVQKSRLISCWSASFSQPSIKKTMETTGKLKTSCKEGEGFIAYRKFTPETRIEKYGIIFCQGLMSNMRGTKANFLYNYCKQREIPYVAFDYQGHGESSGAFVDFSLGLWKENTLQILTELTEGPQIIVGSSIGAWVMLLAALHQPAQIYALVGISSAPDLLYERYDKLSKEAKARVCNMGYLSIHSMYSQEPYKISLQCIDDASKNLVLRKKIPLNCPVRLIHGMRDEVVPYQTSMKLADTLNTNDVQLTLVKDGDHRMSKNENLELLGSILNGLISL